MLINTHVIKRLGVRRAITRYGIYTAKDKQERYVFPDHDLRLNVDLSPIHIQMISVVIDNIQ